MYNKKLSTFYSLLTQNWLMLKNKVKLKKAIIIFYKNVLECSKMQQKKYN